MAAKPSSDGGGLGAAYAGPQPSSGGQADEDYATTGSVLARLDWRDQAPAISPGIARRESYLQTGHRLARHPTRIGREVNRCGCRRSHRAHRADERAWIQRLRLCQGKLESSPSSGS